ncbi:MAG: hypothetical protein RIC18_05885 [Hoeflea sp.]|uniref:hypothetical protein n=1 Tax=Hoeflea sp. TaxID=1940281 RepID=UPI0032EF9426
MADYYTDNRIDPARPSDDGRRAGPARSANAVRSGNATGPLAAIVILIVLGLAGFALWTSGPETANTAAPEGAAIEQATPPVTTEPAIETPAVGVPTEPAAQNAAPATDG